MAYRIYFHKRLKKFMVNIWHKGQNIHIGYFDTMSAAVIARNQALLELNKGLGKAFERSKSKKVTKFMKAKENLKNLKDPDELRLLKALEEVNNDIPIFGK